MEISKRAYTLAAIAIFAASGVAAPTTRIRSVTPPYSLTASMETSDQTATLPSKEDDANVA